MKQSSEAKLEFPRGRGGGAKQKTFHGGVWIFSGAANFEKGNLNPIERRICYSCQQYRVAFHLLFFHFLWILPYQLSNPSLSATLASSHQPSDQKSGALTTVLHHYPSHREKGTILCMHGSFKISAVTLTYSNRQTQLTVLFRMCQSNKTITFPLFFFLKFSKFLHVGQDIQKIPYFKNRTLL